eukprot:270328-Rhodomonas_salina.10
MSPCPVPRCSVFVVVFYGLPGAQAACRVHTRSYASHCRTDLAYDAITDLAYAATTDLAYAATRPPAQPSTPK